MIEIWLKNIPHSARDVDAFDLVVLAIPHCVHSPGPVVFLYDPTSHSVQLLPPYPRLQT